MKHFSHLSDSAISELFERAPQPFGARSDRQLIGTALGAVLYTPATRKVADRLIDGHWPGLTTMVICLEDSIGDADLPAAEQQLEETLRQIHDAYESGRIEQDELPLLYVRVRDPEHLRRWSAKVGELRHILAGFVLPKFGTDNAADFLEEVQAASERAMIMPILESGGIAYRESRVEELLGLSQALTPFRSRIPCVRLGATDLSGLYGLRRNPDMTIYDIGVVRDVIVDVVNVLGRPEGGWTLSGPVWEFYHTDERVFSTRLRASTFEAEDSARRLRAELLQGSLDGLVREVVLDQANGLQGKTIIHPSHIMPVNALQAVTHESYTDALQVLERVESGAGAIGKGGKMNEPKPHNQWAQKTVRRAESFGVLHPEKSWIDVLLASREAGQAS